MKLDLGIMNKIVPTKMVPLKVNFFNNQLFTTTFDPIHVPMNNQLATNDIEIIYLFFFLSLVTLSSLHPLLSRYPSFFYLACYNHMNVNPIISSSTNSSSNLPSIQIIDDSLIQASHIGYISYPNHFLSKTFLIS